MAAIDDDIDGYFDAGGLSNSKAMRRAVGGGGMGGVQRANSLAALDGDELSREKQRKRRVRRTHTQVCACVHRPLSWQTPCASMCLHVAQGAPERQHKAGSLS